MANHWDDEAVTAVRSIKAAIAESQQQIEDAGLEVSKVELALETALTKAVGGGFKIKIVGVEAHRTRSDTQTLTLDLTPAKALEGLGPSLADELRDAIVATAAATKEAAEGAPRFKLDEASVALQVEIKKDGKVSVFVEGSGEKGTTHTLTLTLKPKS
jgi:Trypsin-co-occurring domain 2